MTTKTKSETILALCEAATPGPWEIVEDCDNGKEEYYGYWHLVGEKVMIGKEANADSKFIAACNPAEIRRMVEVMLQMRKALKEYTNVCRSYNDPRDFTPKVVDEGFRAREAIAAFDAWQKTGGE